MPSRSPAQHRLMQAVAHNPAFARKTGIPQSVGQEFVDADRKPRPSQSIPLNRRAYANALRRNKR